MPISVTCGECFTSVRVKEQALGKKFRCKECGAVVVVRPDEEPDDFEAPPVAPPPRRSGGRSGGKTSKPSGRRRSRSKQGQSKFAAWAATFNERFEDDPTWKVACYALVGVALTIGLPFAVQHTAKTIGSANASSSWPQASAKVVASSVSTSRHRRGRVRYNPKVEYTFQVNQQTYRGDRIAFGGVSFSDEAEAQQVASHYARGTEHLIHYDPADPENCVIVPGASLGTWLMLILPAICLMGPLLAMMQGMVLWHRMQNG